MGAGVRMITTKFKSKGKTRKLAAALDELAKEKVQIGWFKEQGNHSSGDSYVDVARTNALGIKDGRLRPRRDPKAIVENFEKPATQKEVRKIISRKIDNPKKVTNEQVLNEIGQHYQKSLKKKLGVPHPLNPAGPLNPDPMLDTGELKDNVGYRTSKNKNIRT